MNPSDIFKNILSDVRIDATQHFDRNFERKAFFNRKWPDTKHPNARGSLMMRSGKLRRSIQSKIQGNQIVFTSSLPYAKIHNDGGEVVVTEKMKRFFWAMYYKSAGAVSKSILQKDGSRVLFVSTESKSRMKKQAGSNSERAKRLNAESKYWRSLALMKLGAKIKIEQRQFIGDHPVIRGVITRAVNNNLKELNNYLLNQLKP